MRVVPFWLLFMGNMVQVSFARVSQIGVGKGCGITTPFRVLKTRPKTGESTSCTIGSFFDNTEFLSPAKPYLTQEEVSFEEFGGWTQWSPWTQCTITCGSGSRTRTRECTSDNPEQYCIGPALLNRYCNVLYCAVHGQWSEWTNWNLCDAQCTIHEETRSRTCSNPIPKHGGDTCVGTTTGTRNCSMERFCPVAGQWSEWDLWSTCNLPSVTCGYGSHSRNRSCSDPAPANGGPDCWGSTTSQTEECLIGCPRNGGWSNWSDWPDCSLESVCGNDGWSNKTRACDNPTAEFGGAECAGEDVIPQTCAIDCSDTNEVIEIEAPFGSWGEWEHCPNAYHMVKFRAKVMINTNQGITGIRFECNDPSASEVSSREHRAGNYPEYDLTLSCPQGFTQLRGLVQPDAGFLPADRSTVCVEVFCEESQVWHKSDCDETGSFTKNPAPEVGCSPDRVICGVRTKVDPAGSDNAGVTIVNLKCCLRP